MYEQEIKKIEASTQFPVKLLCPDRKKQDTMRHFLNSRNYCARMHTVKHGVLKGTRYIFVWR
jgi:hypothetical protein